MKDNRYDSLLELEEQQLNKLKDIVYQSIEEEKLLSEKIAETDEKDPPLSNRMADGIASFGGSWTFIFLFMGVMVAWMIVNAYLLRSAFDPYPFVFLNLVLSTLAALQAPIIMMSQNRREEKDRRRDVNDYLVNLKAEVEIRNLHQKLDLLIAEQMKTLFEIQKAQMEMMEDIKTGLSEKRRPSKTEPASTH